MDAVCDPRQPISILLAAEVRLFRDGLAAVLGAQESLRICAMAGSSRETLECARRFKPDVMVVDVAMEGALPLLRALRDHDACMRILALAVEEDVSSIIAYAEAGADGFVTNNCSVADLVQAIQRVAAGELLCSPRIAAQLLRRAAHRPTTQGAHPRTAQSFTGREQQVLQLLARGCSNKEIASALSIAEATVKNHVHHVLEKLQVTTRAQAAVAIARFTLAPPASSGLDRPI